jgi:hypothetical protein
MDINYWVGDEEIADELSEASSVAHEHDFPLSFDGVNSLA